MPQHFRECTYVSSRLNPFFRKVEAVRMSGASRLWKIHMLRHSLEEALQTVHAQRLILSRNKHILGQRAIKLF